jgi:HindIII restriction endonuclease
MREHFIKQVFEATNKTFPFEFLEKNIQLSKQDLSNNLIQMGVLPEVFAHDSSEEKNWAKLSDIILSQALNFLGIESEVLRARGNSADVFGKTKNYTIVGDAKTFRLSRTAKNQKDFKIKALDDWRKENTFAILVSPLAQYPTNSSQIYTQAIEKNVTLLSYLHLQLLLESEKISNLETLWKTGIDLQQKLPKNDWNKSKIYWQEINQNVCNVTNVDISVLDKYKQKEIEITQSLGLEGIDYWQNTIENYKKLSKEEAIKKLIKAEKIENKIVTIKKAIKFKEIAV